MNKVFTYFKTEGLKQNSFENIRKISGLLMGFTTSFSSYKSDRLRKIIKKYENQILVNENIPFTEKEVIEGIFEDDYAMNFTSHVEDIRIKQRALCYLYVLTGNDSYYAYALKMM